MFFSVFGAFLGMAEPKIPMRQLFWLLLWICRRPKISHVRVLNVEPAYVVLGKTSVWTGIDFMRHASMTRQSAVIPERRRGVIDWPSRCYMRHTTRMPIHVMPGRWLVMSVLASEPDGGKKQRGTRKKPSKCSGICSKLGVSRKNMGRGGGRCKVCELYIMHDKNRCCPCCGYRIRTRVSGSTAMASRARAFSRPRS